MSTPSKMNESLFTVNLREWHTEADFRDKYTVVRESEDGLPSGVMLPGLEEVRINGQRKIAGVIRTVKAQ